MNRHRNDVALVMDSADFRRDSHVRARTPGLGADLDNVIVRPTILIHERRYERRVEAAAGALAMQAAKLHALLAEPLTRPLGSMQTPRCFPSDEAITLIQSKPVGVAPPFTARPHEPARMRRAEVLRESGLGGDYQPYKEQSALTREALPADDQPALARDGAQQMPVVQRTEDNPRHTAASVSMRGSGLGGDRHDAPSELMRELGPGGDRHYAVGPGPMRDMPRDGEQLRHGAASVSLRECESRGDRHYTPRDGDHARHVAPLESMREFEPGGDRRYAAQPRPLRDVPREDEHARQVAPSESMREFGPGDRHYAPRDDGRARQVAPSESMREFGPGADRRCAAQPRPLRDVPRDDDHARHVASSESMREFGPGDRRSAPRNDDHAGHVAPSESMREFGPSGDRRYAAQPGPMRDVPRDGEQLRHGAASVSLRECESGGDRHCSARFAPLRSHRERERPTFDHAHTKGEREAALGSERHRYSAQAMSMCEELPTVDRLRSQGEAAAEAGTYHGLRHVREHAHARLESLEAAAVSGKTAAARPHNAARARNSDADALRQPDATPSTDRSAKPRSSSGKRRRGEGLTDARNALRRAYAESKLRLPNAPPRSSARSAGVVDGWEHLPDKKARRARSRRKGSRAIWPWAAALAASSMFFAYALTLTVVSEPKLAQPLQPIAAEAAPKAPSSSPAPIEQPPAEKPTVMTRPRATGPKSPKPPTRPIPRTECRDQAPPSN